MDFKIYQEFNKETQLEEFMFTWPNKDRMSLFSLRIIKQSELDNFKRFVDWVNLCLKQCKYSNETSSK